MKGCFGVKKLLEIVGRVLLPAIGNFTAQDRFKWFCWQNEEARIVSYNDGFRDFFLAYRGGVVETDIAETYLRVRKFTHWASSEQVIAEIGEEVVETSLAQMFELMKAQGRGQQGILLTNIHKNIFLIRSADGILREVCCYWHDGWCGGGWMVAAGSIWSEWDHRDQVISH